MKRQRKVAMSIVAGLCLCVLFGCAASNQEEFNTKVSDVDTAILTTKTNLVSEKEISDNAKIVSEVRIGQDNNIEAENNIEKSEQESVEEQVEQEEISEELPVKRVVGEDTSEVGGHETENTNYALYPSTIVETDPKDKPSQFAIWEKTIEITFPQIYYSNEYGDYHGSEIETAINHDLFLQSIGNDDSFLFGRDARLLRGCTVDYEITKADDALISVKYMEECWNVFRDHSFCWGITLDTITGEKVALSEFITLEDNLVEQVENGEIQYISSWFEWEDVIDSVEYFCEFYKKGFEDTYSCYYLEEDVINLVIDLMQGNSAYIILRIPLK